MVTVEKKKIANVLIVYQHAKSHKAEIACSYN